MVDARPTATSVEIRPTPEHPHAPKIPDGVFSPVRILRVLRDPYRKSLPRMAWEIARLWRETGRRPGHYLRRFLYRRCVQSLHGFLGEADQIAIWRHVARLPDAAILDDKIRFHRHFAAEPRVRLPRLLGYTKDGALHEPDGPDRRLTERADLARALDSMLAATGRSAVFAKPSSGYMSMGLFRLMDSADIGALWAAIQHQDYVFEENVEQHPVLAAIMPDTLNTLRVITVLDAAGEPLHATTAAKLGRAGGVGDVDHPVALRVRVTADGSFAPYAFTPWGVGGDTFTHHPDTGRRIGGVRLPDFAAAIDIVLRAARRIACPIVGWDVGFSTTGPVLIEGNTRPGFIGNETAQGVGYLAHPVLAPVVRRLLDASATG